MSIYLLTCKECGHQQLYIGPNAGSATTQRCRADKGGCLAVAFGLRTKTFIPQTSPISAKVLSFVPKGITDVMAKLLREDTDIIYW